MKKCTKCGATRSLEEFHRDRRRSDGRMSRCRECVCEEMRRYRREYPERARASKTASYRKNYVQTTRRYRLARLFGITLEEYGALLAAQGGLCAICRRPETTRSRNGVDLKVLAVDHDHDTNRVRGLLCAQCNKGLGNFGDDPVRLAAAIKYLTK